MIASVFIIIAVLVVVEILSKAISGFMADAYQNISGEKTKPSLELFTLNQSKSIYIENVIAKFGTGPKVKTYIADSKIQEVEPLSLRASYPVFNVVIKNTSDQQLEITKITYNIDEVGQVMGVGPGPLKAEYKHTHKLEYKKGIQEYKLVSPITIPKKSSGAFKLAMFTEHPELGLSWWTNVEFYTNKGNVSTDMFQVILSGRPKWALKTLEPQRVLRQELTAPQQVNQQETRMPPQVPRQNGGTRTSEQAPIQRPREPAFLR